MTSATTDSVLRRMTRPQRGRVAAHPGHDDRWRRILPRAAEDALGLDLRVVDAGDGVTELASILDSDLGGALLIGLSQGGGRVSALGIVDASLLSALIEVQTVGRVAGGKTEPRVPTATDVALAAHVLDGWLDAVESAGEMMPWRCVRPLADARAVGLALEDGGYRHLSLTLDVANGKRTGALRFLLPVTRDPAALFDPSALREAILPLPAEIEAVLGRIRLPLSTVRGFEEGKIVPLVGLSVRSVTLEAPRGRVVSHGHLGQSGGKRAVKILLPPDRDRDGAGPHPAEMALVDDGELPGAGSIRQPPPVQGGLSLANPELPEGGPGLPPLG